MIPEFATAWPGIEQQLLAKYRVTAPGSYGGIFHDLVPLLPAVNWQEWDTGRITTIDDGDYQGTLVFIVAEQGYQPSTYLVTKVSYGSCSGCDSFEAIRGYSWDDTPSEQQAKDYVSLALHMLQAAVIV